jgi:hypothetical protein
MLARNVDRLERLAGEIKNAHGTGVFGPRRVSPPGWISR